VREEMDAIGAQEMLLPALHPAELWQESAAGTSWARTCSASRTASNAISASA
jgi:hypothetical protein